MDCPICKPKKRVKIEDGQGSCSSCEFTVYEVHEYSVNRKLAAAYNAKGVEGKIETTGVNLYLWARENAAELYSEMVAAETAWHKMFIEGKKAVASNRFDEDHFVRFCQAMGSYGQLENKILIAYMKADIEVVATFIPEWDQEPAQAEIRV